MALCSYPRCFNRAPCPRHQQRHDTRPSAHQRGYGRRWRAYTALYLREHSLCVTCLAEQKLERATLVDHIQPVTGPDDPLFWEPSNHQALCGYHHGVKTREDVRMGRAGRKSRAGGAGTDSYPFYTQRRKMKMGVDGRHERQIGPEIEADAAQDCNGESRRPPPQRKGT